MSIPLACAQAVVMRPTMTVRRRRSIGELTYLWLTIRAYPGRRAPRPQPARAGRAWTRYAPRDARPSCATGTAAGRSRDWTALRRAARAPPAHGWATGRCFLA